MTLSQAWLDGKTIKLLLLWQEGEVDDVSDLRWGLYGKYRLYICFANTLLVQYLPGGDLAPQGTNVLQCRGQPLTTEKYPT